MGNGAGKIEIGLFRFLPNVEVNREEILLPVTTTHFETKVDQRKYKIVVHDAVNTLYQKQLYNLCRAFVMICDDDVRVGVIKDTVGAIVEHWEQKMKSYPLVLIVSLKESEELEAYAKKTYLTYRHLELEPNAPPLGPFEVPYLPEVVRGIRDCRQIGVEHSPVNVKNARR